jgi:uncharacterized protein YcbK (DUF882 family)
MIRREFIKGFASSVGLVGIYSNPLLAFSGKINDPNFNKILTLKNPHNNEKISATFWRRGWFDYGALSELNTFMRDWRKDEVTEIDPYLFEVLYSISEDVSNSDEIVILSAYRTRETNDWLRRDPNYGASKNSQHIYGRAVDFTFPSKTMSKVKNSAKAINDGGVGFYPKNNFIHIDTGPRRRWIG